MESFLQPLKGSLWLALFVSVFFIGFAIYLLDLKSPFERFYGHNFLITEREGETRVTLGEAMWFVWGVLLNSGVCEKTPKSFSARVLGLFWCGFSMIIVASYTANLAASFLILDQQEPERGLTGVNDARVCFNFSAFKSSLSYTFLLKLRNPSANFSYGTVLYSNTYNYFKRHVELSTMFRKMEGHNFKSASDAIQSLLNGTIGAFIWDSVRLDFEAAKNCELRTRGSLFGRTAYGIGLKKDSPWTPFITAAILRLSESGVLERLESKWIRSTGKKSCVYDTPKFPARLGLSNMRDGLILVVAGIIVSAFLSLLEIHFGRRRQAKKRREHLARRYANHWRSLCRRPPSIFQLSESRKYGKKAAHSLSLLHDCRIRNSIEEQTWKLWPGREVFTPDLNFTSRPCKVYCPRCHNAVLTMPRPVIGSYALCCSGICILLFLFPCAIAPIFLTAFSDYIHKCPNRLCSHTIGRFRRLRSPIFFV